MTRLKASDLDAFTTEMMLLHVRSGEENANGERPIRSTTAEIAFRIASYAYRNHWPLPEPQLAGEGEVEIVWRQGDKSLTFTVTPEDVVVWVSRRGDIVLDSGSEAFADTATIRDTAVVVNEWFEGGKRGALPQ